MHLIIVLVQYLRVNSLKREWWIDLPELTSIQLGACSFHFNEYDDSSELIMRSDDDERNWWIDLPKLTSLTTEGDYSATFENPHITTLESVSHYSILTNRHALSHHCHSWQGKCFQVQEHCSYEESLFLLPLIPRHLSRSPTVFLVYCFFHTQFNTITHSHFTILNLPPFSNKHVKPIITIQTYTLQRRRTTSKPLGGKTRATNQKTPSYLQLQ